MANKDSLSPFLVDTGLDAPEAHVLHDLQTSDGDYWDHVALDWQGRQSHKLWREYTDRLQIMLINRWLVTTLCRTDSSPSKVLKTDLFDELSGRGLVSHLEERGYSATGIDVSPMVVAEVARRNPRLNAIVADVRDLPFPDEYFDSVYSGSTLDHFESPDDIGRSLREISRLLRPGGRLVLTMDNLQNPLVRLRNGPLLGLLRRVGIVPYRVGVTLEPYALVKLVNASGLAVVTTTTVLHNPRVFAVALARLIEHCPTGVQEMFLEHLLRWENLEQWPSHIWTGHFTAILAVKNG